MDQAAFINSLDRLKERIQSAAELEDILLRSEQHNPWFVRTFLNASIDAILHQFIDSEKCRNWLSAYPVNHKTGKRVGLIMAGNIPLVGFHDLFCVLAAGHQAIVKLSDKDAFLLPFIVEQWINIYPSIKDRIRYVDKLDQIDSVIATGSNNSGRYFEYYFRQYPHVFRQNRNGIAILTGHETMQDLKDLAKDIFMFFGLGCRNVSKLFVPEGYDFSQWNEAIAEWKWMRDHTKYRHNLDYNLAIYLINQVPHRDLGHLILKENAAITSRIGCLHYDYYDDAGKLADELDQRREDIQCVVSASPLANWDHVKFGETQYPALHQYADGVDTMQFLIDLNGS